jgi:hypothetical protein
VQVVYVRKKSKHGQWEFNTVTLANELSSVDVDIQYIPERHVMVANGLSRIPTTPNAIELDEDNQSSELW